MNPRSLLQRISVSLPLAYGLWVMGFLATIWWARHPYPYDLEWMEGGVVAHAWRLRHGLPLYIEPNNQFIPMIYPPGLPALMAVLDPIIPLSPALGRAIALLGSLLTALSFPWLTRKRYGRADWGVVAAAGFLSTYAHSGAFMDLVRPDGPALACLAWSLLASLSPKPRIQVLGGLALALGFTFKQNVAIFGFPVALGMWARFGWRDAMRWGLAAAVPAGLYTLMMQGLTDGRFYQWMVDVPQSHPAVEPRRYPGSFRELTGRIPLFMGLAGLAPWAALRARLGRAPWTAGLVASAGLGVLFTLHLTGQPPVKGIRPPEAWAVWTGMMGLGWGVGGLAMGVGLSLKHRERNAWPWIAGISLTTLYVVSLMRAHHGGFINVFMAAHALFALLAVLPALLPGRPAGWAWITALAFTGQLYLNHDGLNYDQLTPSEADYKAGDFVVEQLRDIEGEVLSPCAVWLPTYAGKAPHWHLIAFWDIRHPQGPFRDAARSISRSVAGQPWGAVVDCRPPMRLPFAQVLQRTTSLPIPRNTLVPMTGWRQRPDFLWVPKERPLPTFD